MSDLTDLNIREQPEGGLAAQRVRDRRVLKVSMERAVCARYVPRVYCVCVSCVCAREQCVLSDD